jgi:hypothetical protein
MLRYFAKSALLIGIGVVIFWQRRIEFTRNSSPSKI